MKNAYDVTIIAEKIARYAKDLQNDYERLIARMKTKEFQEYCAEEEIDVDGIKKDVEKKIADVYDALDNICYDIDLMNAECLI